jgi:adenine phosphoribosyltransferase
LEEEAMDLKRMIRTVPDFPKKGIMFRDITTLIRDGRALDETATLLAERFRAKRPEIVLGIESRGFIIGAAVAVKLGVGFAPVRKKGKLPAETIRAEYSLEYGTDCVEIHADALRRGQRVLLIDDLIATGGTAEAAARLVEQAGGTVVGCGFLIDLAFLKGAAKLKKYDVYSLIQYDSE